MNKNIIHVCTGCGKEKKLDPSRKHWCNCNPGAKFHFIVKTDRQLAERMVRSLRPKTN